MTTEQSNTSEVSHKSIQVLQENNFAVRFIVFFFSRSLRDKAHVEWKTLMHTILNFNFTIFMSLYYFVWGRISGVSFMLMTYPIGVCCPLNGDRVAVMKWGTLGEGSNGRVKRQKKKERKEKTTVQGFSSSFTKFVLVLALFLFFI